MVENQFLDQINPQNPEGSDAIGVLDIEKLCLGCWNDKDYYLQPTELEELLKA